MRPWQEDAASFCESLLARTLRRSRSLATVLAIAHVARLEQRLVALFWSLAERWGTMSPETVNVALPLTHQTIADLVGAQRPSVTTALGRLARAGTLTRSHEVRRLIGGPPPLE